MASFSSLFKKDKMGEHLLMLLFIIYLIMGYKTPESVANVVDTLVGKIVILVIVVSLFLYTNPLLAVLSLFVAFDLIRRSSKTTGLEALQKYQPSEQKKMTQFSAYNQFPYTLEQEVVKKMAPIVQSGSSLTKPSYKPYLENLHDASPLNNAN
jgi:hypothetical protein